MEEESECCVVIFVLGGDLCSMDASGGTIFVLGWDFWVRFLGFVLVCGFHWVC